MEVLKVFEEKFHSVIAENVKNVLLESNDPIETSPRKDDWFSNNQNTLSCSYCRVEFLDGQQQRDHYKLDWHRYNLKQSLLAREPITEEDFYVKTGKDDLSSISGSDSEKEDTLDTYATAQGKIFLQNKKGQVFSLYRCLLLDRKEEVSDNGVLLDRLKQYTIINKQWTVFMLGGGHFAGAIFRADEPFLHKTFHCYTVRAGQGGSQSSRDGKSNTQPKSAGASLRRYNEQSLVQHVKSVVEAWKNEIAQSSLIIYRASGPYNRTVLFGGNTPILDRNDKRLRTIPFSTRRATFTEVKRVHSILTTAQVYGSLEMATEDFAKQKSPEQENKRNKIRASAINRAKSREKPERPLPVEQKSSISEPDANGTDKQDSSSEESVNLSTNENEISFEGLKEFGDSLSPEQRKLGGRKKPKHNRKSKTKKLREQEEARKKDILNALFKGDICKLKDLLDKQLNIVDDENIDPVKSEVTDAFFNEVLDDQGNTLLHVAAMNEHKDLLSYLLESNANPCIKNKQQQTAYTCTQSREIRDTLKLFAKKFPDKYNYNKAQIPVNTLNEEEISEKKKAQRKIKKEKEKIKKKENEIKRKEEAEKDRFLKLSDREKRALAAERRIATETGSVLTRCFLCASDMTGKVPFEYLGNRFCTMDCLKAHRMQNPSCLS